MKGRLCAWMLGLALFFACLTGCDTGVPVPSSLPPATLAGSVPEAPAAGAEIAILMPEDVADSEYGQLVWATVSRVAGESAVTSGLYRAGKNDEKTALASVELAVKGGAQLVVMLGEDLAGVSGKVAALYPDIDFILLDMPYDTAVRPNAVLVRYAPEQSGWLAGYASVYEKLGDVGYIVAENEEAERYTLGFLLGADAAARERKAEAGSLRVYPLELSQNRREWKDRLGALYQAAGEALSSIFISNPAYLPAALGAAEEADGSVSCVGPEPGKASASVLVRVIYDPQNVLSTLLSGWMDGRFPGGETVEGTVAGGEIGLQLPKEGFGRFNEQRYQTILDRFRIGGLGTQIALRIAPDEEGALPTPEALGLTVFALGPPAAVPQPNVAASAPARSSPPVAVPTPPPALPPALPPTPAPTPAPTAPESALPVPPEAAPSESAEATPEAA